ncbi:MAG TPA: DMT family transporter [Gaiellaceae bacterium]|jgi:drug/metabolite transporter (DMT)-like permease|nr:DMT family transporter [Gaiellaceae bacterium]
MPADRRGAFVALLVCMVCFGGTWPAGKVAASHVEPAVVAVTRFASAAVLLWLWARLSGNPVRRPSRRDLPLLVVLGFTVVFAYNLCFLYGVRHAPATDGAVLVPGLIPAMTTLLAWPVLGERPARRSVAGLALAFVGVVVVADPTGNVGSQRLIGDVLFVGAAVSWAAYTLAGREATARFGSVSANVFATGIGSLLLLPVSFVGNGWSGLGSATGGAWGSIAYLSLAGTVLAFVLFYEGVRLLGASAASAFALLVPIFGVLSSVLVLGERLHPALGLGGAIVVAGLWLVQAPGRAGVHSGYESRLDEGR